ncbi:MAG: ABC transporter ATP-binding protein [Planctomycetota bacterium]
MLVVRQIQKRFGPTVALRDVSLDAAPGEILGFLGPNGAGKSTTFRIVAGLFRPDSGTAQLDGNDLSKQPCSSRAQIGYLPETTTLYPEMTPLGFLTYRARLWQLRGNTRRRAVASAIDRCGLSKTQRQRIGTLSKGYRQRVALAAAILHDPRLLLLDEPTNGLDPAQLEDWRALIRQLAHDRILILSSHVMGEVDRLCARVAVIAAGRIMAAGSRADVARAAGQRSGVVIEAQGNAAELAQRVRTARGVKAIDTTTTVDGWTRLDIDTDDDDRREAIVAALGSTSIREITRRRASLERAFASLVSGTADVRTDEDAA